MSIKNIPSLVLYFFASLLGIYSLWSFINSAEVVGEAARAGQINIWANIYDIVGFYLVNCAQYFVYALLLTAAGLVLQRQISGSILSRQGKTLIKNNAGDEELDEWLDGDESD